jgi:hypothetical protein
MRGHAAGGAGTSTWNSAHAGASGGGGHVGYVNQFDVEDEVGFRRDPGMFGTVVGDGAHSVGELPGDEEAALATNLHAAEALIEAGNEAPHALGKCHGLRFPQFGFAVVAEHWFAVLVLFGLAGMVEGGVELDTVGGAVASVMDLVHFAGLGIGAGSDFDVLIPQGEGCFDDATCRGNAGGQLDAGGGGGSGLGCGCCRLGGGDSGFGGSLGGCSHGG